MAEHEERTLGQVALLAGATGLVGIALLLFAAARSAAAADPPCAELARVVSERSAPLGPPVAPVLVSP